MNRKLYVCLFVFTAFAFVDNKAEKEKLRARIRADLAKRGASPKTPEGYCTVGREEIAKGSAAGKLLRAR